LESGILECSEIDYLEGQRNIKQTDGLDQPISGDMIKRGRSTNIWLTRYYELRDGTLY